MRDLQKCHTTLLSQLHFPRLSVSLPSWTISPPLLPVLLLNMGWNPTATAKIPSLLTLLIPCSSTNLMILSWSTVIIIDRIAPVDASSHNSHCYCFLSNYILYVSPLCIGWDIDRLHLIGTRIGSILSFVYTIPPHTHAQSIHCTYNIARYSPIGRDTDHLLSTRIASIFPHLYDTPLRSIAHHSFIPPIQTQTNTHSCSHRTRCTTHYTVRNVYSPLEWNLRPEWISPNMVRDLHCTPV